MKTQPLLLASFLALWAAGFSWSRTEPVKPTVTFHVAPAGNDQNTGSREKPFATLQKAQAAVRAFKQAQPKQNLPVTVVISKGAYRLDAPLVLTPEDSGTKSAPVIYAAEAGAEVVISGGKRITGWKQTTVLGKPLWTADLPDVRAGKWYAHQLWVNGQRRMRARHPNQGFAKIAALPDAKKDTPWNQGQNRFRFQPGDIQAYKNLHDVDVVAMHLWVSVRLAVAQVDEQERLVTFAAKSRRRLTDGTEPARYYVENALELLDSPGEWYLDRTTGTLYYWPMPGERIDEVEAVVPVLAHLVRFEGQPEKNRFVEHVVLRGLTFQHAEWWPARTDPVDIQAAAPVPAVIQADGLRHGKIERCKVARASNYGIHLSRGCQQNEIADCELFDLGAGGIKIGEMTQRADPAQQTHGNTVTDNHVHDCGQIFHQGIGIWIGQSFGNRVLLNHVHDLYYTGISCGWTWGYGKTLARGNVIELNHVHHLGKGWLSDLAGVYTLGVQPDTVIRSNKFHDISAYRYGGWGIYFDEGSTHIVAENNLVYRTTHGGFHQHFGKENIVRNNIFALGRDAQIRRTRQEPHRSFSFERNIVYWNEGKLLDGNWDQLNVAFDSNLYWQAKGAAVRFGKLTLEEWQAKGMDRKSLIADPLFANPEQHDFRLADKSPAFKLGFVPLESSRVGPRTRE